MLPLTRFFMRKRTIRNWATAIALLLLPLFCTALAQPQTMRVDYYHTGNTTQELFSLDKVVLEPLPWPGNLAKRIDHTNLGRYFFEVIDRKTNAVLYSRGFDSIYGEWVTTDEARKANRTFHESLRFPAPIAPCQIVVKKRDANNAFREAWSLLIDPHDIFIDRAKPAAPGPLLELEKNGDPATKVDLLLLGDGYQLSERKKFEQDARRLMELLFATSPFKERRKDFNVWGLCPAATESGISRPSSGIYRHSPLGTSYDTFGSERYALTFENRAFRQAASFAPYDVVEIMINSRTYGGGGIFNLYSTAAVDNAESPYIFIHEFGHHFAALADEYYTSSVAYLPATERVEPWEPNVTALLDPATLKWKDLVAAGTPLPTSWQKEEYEKHALEFGQQRQQLRREGRPEQELEALFRSNREFEAGLFAREKYAGKVGAFEGANYEAKGFYRPAVSCIMFTWTQDFCTVCRRAIERVIDEYAKP